MNRLIRGNIIRRRLFITTESTPNPNSLKVTMLENLTRNFSKARLIFEISNLEKSSCPDATSWAQARRMTFRLLPIRTVHHWPNESLASVAFSKEVYYLNWLDSTLFQFSCSFQKKIILRYFLLNRIVGISLIERATRLNFCLFSPFATYNVWFN